MWFDNNQGKCNCVCSWSSILVSLVFLVDNLLFSVCPADAQYNCMMTFVEVCQGIAKHLIVLLLILRTSCIIVWLVLVWGRHKITTKSPWRNMFMGIGSSVHWCYLLAKIDVTTLLKFEFSSYWTNKVIVSTGSQPLLAQ